VKVISRKFPLGAKLAEKVQGLEREGTPRRVAGSWKEPPAEKLVEIHSTLRVGRAAAEVNSNTVKTIDVHYCHNFAFCWCDAGLSMVTQMKRTRKIIKACFIPVTTGPKLRGDEYFKFRIG
jgi:hypothetical protein